ncbi:proton/sodium-translocating pyrophosphatase [Tuwongella immobilis]|uniref:K(+)-insensitive pyrophosphate-energized proton pump n=1 Tax=Tuwongella immobilis TaxID=692036 RepID=A0A6C2YJ43_9BACT|nr:sodium/proton-translocating pyrophosphatase [Tuwongella immobilis]VIP01568.1 potassium transporter : K(+)-insensitive pyrophosphate-energized proton pump OS=Opitutaceae bacterium TAV1 GN=hppA PE=3 SV=1: H_PPase: H_PPase [Tuwongella immobilis]VTR98795.1 potassium transporter : K(+)-insensitive pyrophosphate-energized proton pump OS=Opitutaceae bacterium TAV1 GN=hppA PE=3 SV=1: H_PPase: H_PPase [Tuwongella immobilis]
MLGFKLSSRWFSTPMLALVAVACFALMAADTPAPETGSESPTWQPFQLLSGHETNLLEKVGLIVTLLIAIGGLVYARILAKLVSGAGTGTSTMQMIAQAVREGANAYLRRQFTTLGLMIVVILTLLILVKWPWNAAEGDPAAAVAKQIAIGRGVAFLLGSIFSGMVGFLGMRLATMGNLRVAAAARDGFGPAFRLAYRTGTVTGMLTAGLGLLGGTLIVMYFGEKAPEVLLGYGFGGSLLALFMRVGGGIYTKAADVGADLVGKVEANIAEDDPRNAATIADNVGDNVGDCAGMAADVFESYAVTMVAAAILGYAALGPTGMLFPLIVQAIGILASMVSTNLVGKKMGITGSSHEAMTAINRGFWRSAALSTVGFLALGALYLQFDANMIVGQALGRGLSKQEAVRQTLGWESALPGEEAKAAWHQLPEERQTEIATTLLPLAQDLVPIVPGLDMRAAFACLFGILLAVALNFCTEYWTSTDYAPVKSVAKSCRTGHATNIISGLSLGYESSVWAVLLIAGAIIGAVLLYNDTNSPIFIAFGVAMCGIGMLTLTGDTISMDVFGPVADNASGIGEMGFNRDGQNQPLPSDHPDYLTPEANDKARQILTDLDAVGNTTKAITKGIAIGSAVIAAVSLFASFVAVLITGAEEKIGQLTALEFRTGQAKLTVAEPLVFIGMLIGGAVPFLFSSMTIRAVGRAAYLIINECRTQFRDPAIWDGSKKPDYGRVVDICTGTAQRELIGPGLLAIGTPLIVGFLLGPYALGGFLAGMIVCGQLIGVFMSNAGGAWDNAKKMIEDEPKSAKTGKGSEKHKASVTGDTVGDPLKDTAGPAINPLIKVMNMVSLLALPMVLAYNLVDHGKTPRIGLTVAAVAFLAVAWAWWQSKRMSATERAIDADFDAEEAQAIAAAQTKA